MSQIPEYDQLKRIFLAGLVDRHQNDLQRKINTLDDSMISDFVQLVFTRLKNFITKIRPYIKSSQDPELLKI
jgi:hypothetical protein